MSGSIREYDAKRLLCKYGLMCDCMCVCIEHVCDVDIDEYLNTIYRENVWLGSVSGLVVKPDVLLKRRGNEGLVLLNVSWGEVVNYIKKYMNTTYTHTQTHVTGYLTHFIVEPYIPHKQHHEYYFAIRPTSHTDQFLFSTQGGVSVGDVDSHAITLSIPIKPVPSQLHTQTHNNNMTKDTNNNNLTSIPGNKQQQAYACLSPPTSNTYLSFSENKTASPTKTHVYNKTGNNLTDTTPTKTSTITTQQQQQQQRQQEKTSSPPSPSLCHKTSTRTSNNTFPQTTQTTITTKTTEEVGEGEGPLLLSCPYLHEEENEKEGDKKGKKSRYYYINKEEEEVEEGSVISMDMLRNSGLLEELSKSIKKGGNNNNDEEMLIINGFLSFINKIYNGFKVLHMCYLEVNPMVYNIEEGKFVMLDAACKLDTAAEFLCEKMWFEEGIERPLFGAPFGHIMCEEERYIKELDASSGASLKLTVINPHGRIWTMVAGGGASVIYTDTICELGFKEELANYGEYSGAPTENITYAYAKTILSLVTKEGTYREEGKCIILGGGIANFTSVHDTFKGIITAIQHFQLKLHEYKVQIYVRRGGPRYQDGLKIVKETCHKLNIPTRVFGPETYMTDILTLYFNDHQNTFNQHIQTHHNYNQKLLTQSIQSLKSRLTHHDTSNTYTPTNNDHNNNNDNTYTQTTSNSNNHTNNYSTATPTTTTDHTPQKQQQQYTTITASSQHISSTLSPPSYTAPQTRNTNGVVGKGKEQQAEEEQQGGGGGAGECFENNEEDMEDIKGGILERQDTWHETHMEDVEKDPNFVKKVESILVEQGIKKRDNSIDGSISKQGSPCMSPSTKVISTGINNNKGLSITKSMEEGGILVNGFGGSYLENGDFVSNNRDNNNIVKRKEGVNLNNNNNNNNSKNNTHNNRVGKVINEEVNKNSWFSKETRCFVWGLQTRAVQEMLDFDHVCGREEASVSCIIYEFSVSHLRPFYFGTEEIFIPICESLDEAVSMYGKGVSVLVNFASFRSAGSVVVQALNYPHIFKTIATIAEGIPERTTREMNVLARERGVNLIGPSTVGGIKPGVFRIGNTGGTLENIMNAKLYRGGSVGLITRSGGMLNELNNLLSQKTDGVCEAVAIGGDRFPGTSMIDHAYRFNNDPNISMLVVLGEIGGDEEYRLGRAIECGKISKPVVAWCVGTCATLFTTEVTFGHAGAWAGGISEYAEAKNDYLRSCGAIVPFSFHYLGEAIECTYTTISQITSKPPHKEPDVPRVPMDYAWAKKLGLVRRPKGFVSSISDDRGEELLYAGWPVSKVVQSGIMGVGGVISLLWFKRPLPEYCYRYLERVLMLTADHGPAVCGAHNTIVTARAGKDLISSLISGLCTIGDRFGGACDMAAHQFLDAYKRQLTPEYFVKHMRTHNKLIMGIGHKIKTASNPDMRVELLYQFCKQHFKNTPIIDYAKAIERITTKKKDTLILNVDGLIGASLCDMLYGCGAFTDSEAIDYIENGCINGLFVLGRSIGFIGHFLDQKRLKQGLYRHDVDDISYVLPDVQ